MFHPVQSDIQIVEFLSLTGRWEIIWTYSFHPKPNSSGRYRVEVSLRSEHELQKIVTVDVTAASILTLGSVWENGRLIGYHGTHRRFSLDLDRPGQWMDVIGGYHGKDVFPKHVRWLSGRERAGGVLVYTTRDKRRIIFPTWVIFSNFYAFDPVVAIAAFCGNNFEDEATARLSPHDPTRSGWIEQPYCYRLCRKADVSELSIKRYARTILSDSGRKSRQVLANWALLSSQRPLDQSQFPRLALPMVGQAQWTVLGIDIDQSWLGTPATLVLRIDRCIAKMPFKEVVCEAWNDATPAALIDVPRSAYGGKRTIPDRSDRVPPVGAQREDKNWVRRVIEVVGMQDLSAENVLTVPAAKIEQTSKSAEATVVEREANELTTDLDNSSEGGVGGARFDIKSHPPENKKVIKAVLMSVSMSLESLASVTATAYDLLIKDFAVGEDLGCAKWLPDHHHEYRALVTSENGSRQAFSFLVIVLQIGGTWSYAIDFVRQRPSEYYPVTVVRRRDRQQMSSNEFGELFTQFAQARREGRSWSSTIGSSYEVERVIHPKSTLTDGSGPLRNRLLKAFSKLLGAPLLPSDPSTPHEHGDV